MFDLWLALCTITGRTGIADKLPKWNTLIETVAMISKLDRRKLMLQYHPDKLAMSLGGRSPTVEEIQMSNLAMSALNLLFSQNYILESKSIMATMTELDTLYKMYIKTDKKQTKRKPSAYNNFVKQISLELKTNNKKRERGDFMKEIGAMWKALSLEEKATYA
jgi:hypothetical protein